MPTPYPKCSPTELLGLLVLLKDHKGTQDIARLGDDLDLEIDEILPALEFASVLQLVHVTDGAVTFTDVGKKLMAGSIIGRKTILRDQLRKTTLFKALLRALDNAPEHQLTESEVVRLIEFTTAPADEFVQNIINWGRYAELFRYDADEGMLLATRAPSTRSSGGGGHPPSPGTRTNPGTSGGHTGGDASAQPMDSMASFAGIAA